VSETAISSQIALEANLTRASVNSAPANESTQINSKSSKSQDSEFKQILDKSQSTQSTKTKQSSNTATQQQSVDSENDITKVDDVLPEMPPETLNLTASLNTPLMENLDSLGGANVAVVGNLLPTPLLLQGKVNALPVNNADLLPASNLSKAAILNTNMTEDIPVLNSLGMSSDVSIEDDLLTTQFSANSTENNATNLKQLNVQMLGQLITNQAPSSEQNTLLAASSSLPLHQNTLLKAPESMLPAITVSPDNAQWNNQVGERINWMITGQMQRVEIRLDPPELGTLDIRLNMVKENQANIMFHVSNASAKEAIESAIPRLREMFEQQGIDLGDVEVSQESFQQHQESAFEQYNRQADAMDSVHSAYLNGNSEGDPETILATTNLQTNQSTNLLDIFA